MKIIRDTQRGEIIYYILDGHATREESIITNDGDGIAITVWKNGFLHAGGIWQVQWSHKSKQYYLERITAFQLDVVEVATLLSAEELNLVEQAIKAAYDFWKRNFSDAHFVFLSCEEVHGDTLELHRQSTHEDQLHWPREITWHITFNRFSEGGPNPTECRTIVYYHPDSQATPFTVEIA